MSQGFSELEQQALAMLLAGDDPVLAILRQQSVIAQVKSREFTGVGFCTNYLVPDDSLAIPSRKSFALGGVVGEIEGFQHHVTFVLHIQQGLLSSLKGTTHDEEWPEEIKTFKLGYLPGKRGLEELRKALS